MGRGLSDGGRGAASLLPDDAALRGLVSEDHLRSRADG